jgi:hypothetical protein
MGYGCDDICGLREDCFAQVGIPLQRGDRVHSRGAHVELVGSACVNARGVGK